MKTKHTRGASEKKQDRLAANPRKENSKGAFGSRQVQNLLIPGSVTRKKNPEAAIYVTVPAQAGIQHKVNDRWVNDGRDAFIPHYSATLRRRKSQERGKFEK
jgi:hypothetical protein